MIDINKINNTIEELSFASYPMGESGTYAKQAVESLKNLIKCCIPSDCITLSDAEKVLAKTESQRIFAIKNLRSRTGCSLECAKKSVEFYKNNFNT